LHHKKRTEKGELKYHELLEIININAHGKASDVENFTVSHHESSSFDVRANDNNQDSIGKAPHRTRSALQHTNVRRGLRKINGREKSAD
jgi:type II secretory pathway component PulL